MFVEKKDKGGQLRQTKITDTATSKVKKGGFFFMSTKIY